MKFLETIRLENGLFDNLQLHQERLNRTRKELLGVTTDIELQKILLRNNYSSQGLFKCRITYSGDIESVEFEPYALPSIKSLRLATVDQISYDYKYKDRQALKTIFDQRLGLDDVLIVKQGLITDTSYANILFFDGKQWLTPDQPLLKGTRRESLLRNKSIRAVAFRETDLRSFQKARLINAMMRFEDKVDIDIQNIQR